jgi:gliding motility-associated-like protein
MKYSLLLLGILVNSILFAQLPEYYMSNATVSDCSGTIYDSEEGLKTGEYDHNEDFIFTICVSTATSVTLTFNSFCTEVIEDYVIIYDGKDTNSTRMGTGGRYHGTKNPGSFTSSGSCITIYFHSDKSVACFGWDADWTTKRKPLQPPKFVAAPDVPCSSQTIGIKMDQKLDCDSINNFKVFITGTDTTPVSAFKAINCDGNNQTDTFNVTFSKPLDKGGSYNIVFTAILYDVCDSIWNLRDSINFVIDDCPIEVDLAADPDTICRGNCTEIEATVTGGDSTKYVFTWNNGVTGKKGPHTVCPTATTWYKLTVSDGVSVPDTDSVLVVVTDPPVTMNDTVVCRSSAPFILTALPSTGYWKGTGILDSNTGRFSPTTAGPGAHIIYYWDNGCADSMKITVRDINAGLPNASCPGLAPFKVTGHSPVGGTWTGTNITTDGWFDPKDTGVYIVTYTWQGCTDTKTINVYPVKVPDTDTFCLSDVSVILKVGVAGGSWSGKGIKNPLSGIFYPPTAKSGTHELIYNQNGCRDTTYVTVIAIDARWNEVTCAENPPFNVIKAIPAGGYWTGRGIVDSLLGTYDASFVTALGRTWYNDSLFYHLNGCVDFKMMYTRRTEVRTKIKEFCIEDSRLALTWATVRRTPGGGKWTGPGIKGNYFTPRDAGYGTHKLYYTRTGCTDSTTFVVHPKALYQADTSFCISDPTFALYNGEGSGFFSGKGIIDQPKGLFRPSSAGVGFHTIYFESQYGCLDSLEIEVYGKPKVSITPIAPSFCVTDVEIEVFGFPEGGVFTGTGMIDSFFNPKRAGTGTYSIMYKYGTPTCFNTAVVKARVIDTLKLTATTNFDTICEGESVILTASGQFGRTANHQFKWSTGESSKSVLKTPVVSTLYTVTLSDNCSDPVIDSLLITVHPKVRIDHVTSAIKCYGELGYAEIIPRSSDPHTVEWATSPAVIAPRLNALVADFYDVSVKNNLTGCSLDTTIFIPGYNKINAYFVTFPREGYCLNPFDPKVEIINQSIGGITGTWDFGDSIVIPYDPAGNPSHVYDYDQTGYVITLRIENEGGCKDSFKVNICLDDSVYIVLPNAFSPKNDDGLNNEFFIHTAGVDKIEFYVYTRWGELVYFSEDKDFRWDGTYRGELLQLGGYIYQIIYKGKKTPYQEINGVLHIIR